MNVPEIWADKTWWEKVEKIGDVGSFTSNNTLTTFLNTVKITSDAFEELMLKKNSKSHT